VGLKTKESSRVSDERRYDRPSASDALRRQAPADLRPKGGTGAWVPKQLFRQKTWANAARLAHALGLEPLQAQMAATTDAQLLASIRRTEASQGHTVPAAQAKKLAHAAVGQTQFVPMHFIRPGQTDLSLTNVRVKTLDFVERIDAARGRLSVVDLPEAIPSLLGYEEALTAVVGPGGKYLVLTDGHHHVAALKAVHDVVQRHLTGWHGSDADGQPWKASQDIAAVSALLGGAQGVPSLPIKVVENYSALSEAEFWKKMRGESGSAPLVYLGDVNGRKATVPPKTFGALKNNPFRYLASQTTGKIDLNGKGDLKLRGADRPVWLKTLGRAPAFIEFKIAKLYKAAFDQLGLRYDPNVPLSDEARAVCRWALLQAKRDPRHWAHSWAKDLNVIIKDIQKDRLQKRLSADPSSRDGVHVPHRFLRPSKRRVRRLDEAARDAAARAPKRPE
jgi:hypothetical protein